MIVLHSGVGHMPSKKKSIEGSFVRKNKTKKGKKTVYKNIHSGLRRQLQEAESILVEEDDMPIESSPPCGQELPVEIYPEVVLYSGLSMKKCHGCKGQIV